MMTKHIGTTLAFIAFLFGGNMTAENNTDNSASSCVIVLHGLGRTSDSMNKITQALNENSYRVGINLIPLVINPLANWPKLRLNLRLNSAKQKILTR